MQYKPETEKVAMVAGPYQPVVRPLSLAEDREVQRTRKIFMIILGVCLALAIVGLVSAIFGSGLEYQMGYAQRGTQVGESIVTILFYGFGLFVAHRYSTIGLRIFGWLGVICLVVLGIIIVALTIRVIVAASAANDFGKDSNNISIAWLVIGVIGVVLIAGFILLVIIVKFAFKLARVIDANQRLTIQQI